MCESPLYALIALRGDAGPTGNVVSGGAFCLWEAALSAANREASLQSYPSRPNHAWTSDITYLPMAHGFMYLVAILDVASRKVLAFRLSNTLTADFCIAALEEALAKFGSPEIFNTDHDLSWKSIAGTESFPAKMTLEIAGLKLNVAFTGEITLQ